MRRLSKALIALFALLVVQPFQAHAAANAQVAATQGVDGDPLQAADRKLASVTLPILRENARLCRVLAPATGLVLHSRDQYANPTFERFSGDSILAIAAVASGSPAESAGLTPGLAVLAIGDSGPVQWQAARVTPLRDAAYAFLFGENQDSLLVISDGAEARTVQLRAPLGCRALVEVTTESGLAARADGRVIQVSYGLVARASEAELAVIVAHELSHQILEHRRRLDLAGVRKGFFGQFGGNLAANRMAEEEADRLSVHLLANAGFDPDIAPQFWRTGLGVSLGSGLFRNRAYRSPDDRAAFLDREIDRYLGNGAGPTYPGHLLIRRDGPIIY